MRARTGDVWLRASGRQRVVHPEADIAVGRARVILARVKARRSLALLRDAMPAYDRTQDEPRA
jgi:hypothetical protein